jgi:hypothetical protein
MVDLLSSGEIIQGSTIASLGVCNMAFLLVSLSGAFAAVPGISQVLDAVAHAVAPQCE